LQIARAAYQPKLPKALQGAVKVKEGAATQSVDNQEEIKKLFPDIVVSGVACPLWAAIVEANEGDSPGADYFVKKRIDQLMRLDSQIDTIVLGCTHYPLLMNSIVRNLPDGVRALPQARYVAESLRQYLVRHADIDSRLTKGGSCRYYTTESADRFSETALIFLHEHVEVSHIDLDSH